MFTEELEIITNYDDGIRIPDNTYLILDKHNSSDFWNIGHVTGRRNIYSYTISYYSIRIDITTSSDMTYVSEVATIMFV